MYPIFHQFSHSQTMPDYAIARAAWPNMTSSQRTESTSSTMQLPTNENGKFSHKQPPRMGLGQQKLEFSPIRMNRNKEVGNIRIELDGSCAYLGTFSIFGIFHKPYQFIWVNYNDLTVLPQWESWLVRGIIPKWPYFSLVNYYNLPIYI